MGGGVEASCGSKEGRRAVGCVRASCGHQTHASTGEFVPLPPWDALWLSTSFIWQYLAALCCGAGSESAGIEQHARIPTPFPSLSNLIKTFTMLSVFSATDAADIKYSPRLHRRPAPGKTQLRRKETQPIV